MMSPKCPNCGSDDIGVVRMMEECHTFEVIDGNGSPYIETDLTDLDYVSEPEIRCWNCNKRYSFKEFLEIK
jgi:DNA-directed RNA polymerase subunit RPC12/RpoP